MKIVVTTFTYSPNKDGVSEAARSMAEGFASHGHSVVVLTSAIAGEEMTENRNGVSVVRFNLANYVALGLQPKSEQARFVDVISQFDPDVLVNHCWETWPALLSFERCHDIRARKVQSSHGLAPHIWTPSGPPFFGLGVWLRGLVWTARFMPSMLRWYDAVILLENMKGFGRFFDHTLACWFRHPNVQLIPNSASVPPLKGSTNSFRNRHSIGRGPMFLCVANYSERKNQALAVRAFDRASIPDSTLVFIGSEFNAYSERVNALAACIREKSPSRRILFLEGVSRRETLDAFSDCDIFLLTAKAETQPFVLIESMAAGRPWISTPTGCVSMMEGGITAKGTRGLASAMKELVSNRALAISLGLEGRRAAEEKYSSEGVLLQWEQLLESIL